MKKRAKQRKPKRDKRSIGEDTVVISNDTIIERYSSLYKALMALDGTGEIEVPADLTDKEEEFFYELLGRKQGEGQYVVHKQFARGGMGILYHVFDRDFQRHTIMKVLLPGLKTDSTLIRAFVREARITGQLEHPNIVPVHDLGFLPGHGIYFTMKHVQGESLNDILYQLEINNPAFEKRYDFYALLNIFRRICDAVAYAHSRKIIHRDIKPHNIMVGNYGEAMLMDWGLAKRIDEITTDIPISQLTEGDADVTDAVILKGSPGYMSPEQAGRNNAPLDERSDIFLLGATLYHVFTYFPPYVGATITTIITSARNCDYLPPRELSFGQLQLPEDLCRIISKCMQPEKEDRYQSVPELIADLDALIHGKMDYEHRSFKAGELLMQEGDKADLCYIIDRGKVEVYKGQEPHRTILNTVGRGAIIGEMALITHGPRTASVVALKDTRVLVLNHELFDRNLSRLPPWMKRTVTTLAERLGAADARFVRRESGSE